MNSMELPEAIFAHERPARMTRATDRSKNNWSLRRQLVVATVLQAGVLALIFFAFFPGTMISDSLLVTVDAKNGTSDSFYAPVLTWIWHPFFSLGFGPGWSLLLQLALFFSSAFVLLRRSFSPIPAAIVVSILALSPQLFNQLAMIGRNNWFLALQVACFACVSEATWSRGVRRLAWAFGTVAFAWLAIDARPNGAAAVFASMALLAGICLVCRWNRRRWALVATSLVVGIIATVALYGTNVLAEKAVGPRYDPNISQLYVYDLASMSRNDHHDYFPRSLYPAGTLRSIERLSSPQSILSLYYAADDIDDLPQVKAPSNRFGVAPFERRWRHEILAHPLTYLLGRLQLMGWTLGITHDQIQIDVPDVPQNSYGIVTRFHAANRIANDYEATFTTVQDSGGAIFAPGLFMLICLAALAAAARRPTRERIVMGALSLAVLMYQIGLMFSATGVNYRYEAPCIAVAGIILAVMLRNFGRLAPRKGAARIAVRTRIRGTVATALGRPGRTEYNAS